MFFDVVVTHTKCIINDFAPAPRTHILILQCHTVTHDTNTDNICEFFPPIRKTFGAYFCFDFDFFNAYIC